MSCTHRYTNSLICAVPCDGRDDLCEDYADEVGCKPSYFTTLLGSLASGAILIYIIYFIIEKSRRTAAQEKDSIDLSVLANYRESGSDDDFLDRMMANYIMKRSSSDFGDWLGFQETQIFHTYS